MSPDRPPLLASNARILALAALGGAGLGISAQLLRQVSGPLMALGGATAPWLTIGFLLTLWATRRNSPLPHVNGVGIATLATYLVMWLLSYHLTFSIRESIGIADAWREAAPWLLLSGPAGVILGPAAAATHRRDFAGDVCVALPIAWSTPEVIAYTTEGWTYAVLVAIPTAVLALMPFMAVGRLRDMRPLHVLVAGCSFALAGMALLPLLRNVIHSY